MHKLIGILFIGSFVFFSCEEPEDLQIDRKHAYFPLTTGHYVIYDVDSIVFNQFTGTIDTFRYQRKYVIDSSFVDVGGEGYCRLLRYLRQDSNQAWLITDAWSAEVINNTLEVIEENQRFAKLMFPPRDEQEWDGNKYIDSLGSNWWFWLPTEWEYTVKELDIPQLINGIQFDSTLTVMQQSDSTFTEKVVSIEQYAKHVGMIYKQFIEMEKRTDITRPWTNPERGLILTMTVNSYGN